MTIKQIIVRLKAAEKRMCVERKKLDKLLDEAGELWDKYDSAEESLREAEQRLGELKE